MTTEIWSPMYENESDVDGEYEFEISNLGNVRHKEIWVPIYFRVPQFVHPCVV